MYLDYVSTNWTSGKNVIFKAGFAPGRALYLNVALIELPQRKEKIQVRPCRAGESKGLHLKRHTKILWRAQESQASKS